MAESEAVRRAHAAGLGPEVLRHTQDVLITRFINDAQPLSASDLQRSPLRLRCAQALRQLHEGPTWASPQRAGWEWQTYLTLADEGRIPPQVQSLRPVITQLTQALWSSLSATAPCHVDPSATNWILSGDALYLIDWEYAANGDPLWDLADLAEDAALDEGARRHLLDAWWGAPAPEALWQRLEAWRRVVIWTWATWGLAMERTTGESRFLHFAEENLQRVSAMMLNFRPSLSPFGLP